MDQQQVTSKRSIRKAKTRQAIKEAAMDIARSQGWSGVTIRKIADSIDYTPPIVYEYFKNKDDLYHQLVQDGFNKLARETLTLVEQADNPEEKLLKMAEVRFHFALDNPTLHHLMFDTENPQWQQMEMAKAMLEIKKLVDDLVMELCNDKSRAMEYIFNLICLIKGYTFFANHLMNTSSKMRNHFPSDRKSLTDNFLNAIRRFIASMQNS